MLILLCVCWDVYVLALTDILATRGQLKRAVKATLTYFHLYDVDFANS